jgi:hypothetical protein
MCFVIFNTQMNFLFTLLFMFLFCCFCLFSWLFHCLFHTGSNIEGVNNDVFVGVYAANHPSYFSKKIYGACYVNRFIYLVNKRNCGY